MKWITFLFLMWDVAAFAHPTLIRYGYTNCVACHQSPQGGGILTPYGKGIGGSASLLQSEYEPSQSSFYKVVTADSAIDHGGQARLMILRKPDETAVFPMQMDYLNAVHFTKEWHFFSTLGIQPDRAKKNKTNKSDEGPENQDTSVFHNMVLRKAWVSYRPAASFDLSFGRDFVPAGLNLDDHTAYVRYRNRRNNTDFVTQVQANWIEEKYQVTPFLYAPSFQEETNNREYGAGVRGEYALSSYITAGAFTQVARSQAIEREVVGFFSRVSEARFGALFEYDLSSRRILQESNTRFAQHAFFLRPFFAASEYLELGLTSEYLNVREPFVEKRLRVGPNAYFRLNRNLSFMFNVRQELLDDQSEAEAFAQIFGHF